MLPTPTWLPVRLEHGMLLVTGMRLQHTSVSSWPCVTASQSPASVGVLAHLKHGPALPLLLVLVCICLPGP